MKFLIIPSNNSLSHIAKGMALYDVLKSRGHEIIIACGQKHSKFMNQIGIPYEMLPDIQEADDSSLPTIHWFKDPRLIKDVILSEVKLIKKYRPDYIIGIFRYTAKISSLIANVPYYSLICGCMIPECKEVLGFSIGTNGYEEQKLNLKTFENYATSKINYTLKELGTGDVDSIKYLLKGDKTFLWDFSEFMPLSLPDNIIHIGPVTWKRWSYEDIDISGFMNIDNPLAVIAFGTSLENIKTVERLINIMLGNGYKVLLAGGGQSILPEIMLNNPNFISLKFAHLLKIFLSTSILITHGGQMTLFESLVRKVPAIIMPFQPEQDHNGLCLERIGCGMRLIEPQPFRGNPSVYIDALSKMSDREIALKINSLMNEINIDKQLSKISKIIKSYKGVETLADYLEN